jgi:glycosyltransferase involved in cell wall biosynthesis
MTTILAFSKYLSTDAGGAELSTRELLMQEAAKGKNIAIGAVKSPRLLGRALGSATFPIDWEYLEFRPKLQLSRFPYSEYVLNRSELAKWASGLPVDELWAYGIWGPAAIIGFSRVKKYFVRSETDLGIYDNYHKGWRQVVRRIYGWAEAPAHWLHRQDLAEALKTSTVVANSKYMATRVNERFGVLASVVYPRVDIDTLRNGLASSRIMPERIVFVGDSAIKGLPLVLRLAKRLPGRKFRIYSRIINREFEEGNILWTPWQKESWKVFTDARLVLVPSQCAEAFGRVSREAYLLGVPVLASEIGGLPESVDGDTSCLVRDYANDDAWYEAIHQKL